MKFFAFVERMIEIFHTRIIETSLLFLLNRNVFCVFVSSLTDTRRHRQGTPATCSTPETGNKEAGKTRATLPHTVKREASHRMAGR